MRIRQGLVLAVALGIVGGLALPSTTSACSCRPPLTPTESLAVADAVFVGSVVEVVRIGVQEQDFMVTLSVQRSWKGVTLTEVEVRTPVHSSLCGYDSFQKGGQYLIYASATPEGKLSTNICTRTRTLAQAEDDLVELGPSTVVGTEYSTFGGMKGHFER